MKIPENKEENLLQEESLTSKLLKKGFWLYFFSYIMGPIGYLIRIIISNSISVEEVGVLYSIMGFIGLLSAYNGLWLTESLKYFIPQYYIKKQYDYIKTSLFWSLGVQLFTSIFIVLFLFFWADWLALHYFHSPEATEILKYLCLYFVGINIFQVITSLFISFQDTFNNKVVDFLRLFGILIFTWCFFFFGEPTLLSYSLSWVFWLFFALCVALFIFFKKYSFVLTKGKIVLDKKMLGKFWKYSLWTFISMNAWLLLWMLDQQMVIFFLGPKKAGYYTNYLSLLNVIWIFVGPIFWLLRPLFTEIFTKKDWKKLKLLQDFLYSYLWVFTLSFSALFVVLGPEIATILFGSKYLLSGNLLTFGAGSFVINILSGINFSILAGMGKVKKKTLIVLLGAVVNVMLNLLFLQFLWLYWIILSTILGSFLLCFLSFRIVHKNCKIQLEMKFILKNMLLFILLGGVVYLVKSKIFVVDDALRWKNLLYIVLIWLVWYGIIGLVNIGKLKFLKWEVEKLRR